MNQVINHRGGGKLTTVRRDTMIDYFMSLVTYLWFKIPGDNNYINLNSWFSKEDIIAFGGTQVSLSLQDAGAEYFTMKSLYGRSKDMTELLRASLVLMSFNQPATDYHFTVCAGVTSFWKEYISSMYFISLLSTTIEMINPIWFWIHSSGHV